jgi:hypothetical protein
MASMSLAPPYLTDAEITDICHPLTQPAAQVRYLRELGLMVNIKPNGRPLVGRAHFEHAMTGREVSTPAGPGGEPDAAALIERFRGKHGAHKKKQSAQPA